jgi:hypothetical protein
MGFQVSRAKSGRDISFVSVTFNGEAPELKARIAEDIELGGNLFTKVVQDSGLIALYGHTYDVYRDGVMPDDYREITGIVIDKLQAYGAVMVKPRIDLGACD